MVKTYFTTYENELNAKLTTIKPENFIDIKLSSASYTFDGQPSVDYGFLLIYKEEGSS